MRCRHQRLMRGIGAGRHCFVSSSFFAGFITFLPGKVSKRIRRSGALLPLLALTDIAAIVPVCFLTAAAFSLFAPQLPVPQVAPRQYLLAPSLRTATMVEGHSVHRIAAAYRSRLVGRAYKAMSPNGRFGDGAKAIDGRQMSRIEVHDVIMRLCSLLFLKRIVRTHIFMAYAIYCKRVSLTLVAAAPGYREKSPCFLRRHGRG
jgi:hypothetical protein